MVTNSQRERYLKRGIIAFLSLLFFLSVFILVADRFHLQLELAFGTEETREIQKVITVESEWDYMDGGGEPGVGNVWTTSRYSTDLWKKGAGEFAAGDARRAGEAAVFLDSHTESSKYAPTYFFRKDFVVDDVNQILSMEGKIKYSDAVVVYLNGQIVFAGNVPAGGYSSNQETGAAQTADRVWESQFYVTDLSALKEGRNILSVEVHQEDQDSADAYFAFEYFNLLGVEIKEGTPDTAGVILEQGQNEEQIGVNWLTRSPDFYKVEYQEASEYDQQKKNFSSTAQSRLMGRTYLEGSHAYVNRVTLTHLKTGSEYLYRITRVGSDEGSEIMSFTTAEKPSFSFALLGDPQIGAYGKDDRALWQEQMKKGFALIGKTNFILSAGDEVDGIGETADIIETFFTFRSPGLFKEIPMGLIKGNHEKNGVTDALYDGQFVRDGQSSCGDYSFTYLDGLIVALDSNDMDFEAHREFLKNAVEKAKRKWIIVLMHHSLFSGGEHEDSADVTAMREAYSEMFQEFNVDLVLSGHDHIYSRSRLMSGEEATGNLDNETVSWKKRGETLYITVGSSSGNKFYEKSKETKEYTAFSCEDAAACITRVDVGKDRIQITAYRLDTGEKIDQYQLYDR